MLLNGKYCIFISVGVNTVLRAFPWKQGDEILTTTYTYKAVQNTCHRVSQLSTGRHNVLQSSHVLAVSS